jgi:biopolymer transport protein ExbB/TolQ
MATSPLVRVGNRPGITATSFLVGLPLAAGLLCAIHLAPWHSDAIRTVRRYVTHPVQWAVVAFFCAALGTLLVKLWHTVAERRACRNLTLPPWDGKPVPAAEACRLSGCVEKLSYRLRRTYIARRVAAVLDFLTQRRSTDGFDDQLRALADADSIALEQSYALTRFITWAMPILGFLGTVLGITGAISGITPEVLEKSLSGVTDGLSEAFDSTALALGLTMLTMFVSFLVEKSEQSVVEEVDRFVDEQLAHRFQRTESVSTSSPAQGLMEIGEKLVQRQADIWARTFTEKERLTSELIVGQQDRLSGALETALERTLQSHTQRLSALEKQTVEQSTRLLEQIASLALAVRETAREQLTGLKSVGEMMAAQATTLVQIQTGEKQLIQLQTTMHQNLSALAGAGAFEQAVHNLTAAVHLLTSRTLPMQVAAPFQAPPSRPIGKAA